MTVVNDVPGAWEKIRAEGERLGSQLNIPREILWAFFNQNGRFPQNIPELEAFGNSNANQYNFSRRDPTTGAWHPIMPGVNPGPTLTSEDRGGFPHNITNAEDSDVQRFKDFNPGILNNFGQGTVAGQSTFRAPGARTGFVAGNGQDVFRTMEIDPLSPAYQAANPDGQPFGSMPPASGTAGGPPPSSSSGTQGASGGFGAWDAQAAELASLAEFRNRELATLRLPQFEFQKDYSNRQLAQQQQQFMAQLQQQTDEITKRYGEAAAQRHLQEVLGRGNLALGGLGLASQEALGRMNVGLGGLDLAARDAATRMSTGVAGLNAAQADAASTRAAGVSGAGQASSEALGRINAGIGAYQGAEQAAQNRINAGIAAYGQAGQLAGNQGALGVNALGQVAQNQLNVGNLINATRGPANAFQQMKVAGFVAPGLARALAGEAGVPAFQAPGADPRAATLADQGFDEGAFGEVNRQLMQYGQRGLDPYADQATAALMNAGRVGDDPYAGQGTQGLLRLGQQGENPYDSASQRLNLAYGERGLNPYDSQVAQMGMGYADRGLNDAYGSDVARMGQGYGQMGMDPYNSPTIQGALGLAGPNAQYAVPGSATSQIPGLAGNVNSALQQLRDTNYGMPANPAQGVNDAISSLRTDPTYLATMQRASAGDQNAVQQMRQLEGNAVARATGLDPQQGLQLVTQWRATPGMRTPQELEASINPLVGEVRLRKETGVLQQVAGLDPTAAEQVIRELRQGTGTTGQPSSPEQIERILAQRLGTQGLGQQIPPGTGSFGPAAPTMSVGSGGRDFGMGAFEAVGGAGTQAVSYRAPGGAPTIGAVPGRTPGPEYGGFGLDAQQVAAKAAGQPGAWNPSSGMGIGQGMSEVYRRTPNPASPMGAAAPYSGAPTPGGLESGMTVLPGGTAPQGYQAPGMGFGSPTPQQMAAEAAHAQRNAGQMTRQLSGMGPMGMATPDPAAIARQYTGGVAPNQINSAAFGRLGKSAQQFTLGAYEAQGYDPNDVLETIQRTLPKAVGARRGFVAPAA